jgi:hypothetical protein
MCQSKPVRYPNVFFTLLLPQTGKLYAFRFEISLTRDNQTLEGYIGGLKKSGNFLN